MLQVVLSQILYDSCAQYKHQVEIHGIHLLLHHFCSSILKSDKKSNINDLV